MATALANGYYVPGINNVMVRLYPQVLGLYKIHEHNLCNALRDFGLILKSDSRRYLLQYNYDFLKFIHLMRSSEICMITHGYSMMKLDDQNWWNSLLNVCSDLLYDMDGKEIAGFVYSLSRVFSNKNLLIENLMDESKSWISLYSPISLSLLVKSASHFKFGPEVMKMLNKRSLELIDDLNVVDIVFFMTCNVDAKTHDINFFKNVCLRLIDAFDQIELHHIRAIAASLSMGGFKSHFMFNVLTMRLWDIREKIRLNDGDVISLLLAFTTQKFLLHNDLCIDSKVYKNFMKNHQTSGSDIFSFPLPEFRMVMGEVIMDNKHRITANGMPILLRGISILEIPLSEEFMDELIAKTCKYLDQDSYRGLKLSNLVVTFAKFGGGNTNFWKAVNQTLNRQHDWEIDGNMLSKMINTISSLGRDTISESQELSSVYQTLMKKCTGYASSMGDRSVVALSRHLSLSKNYDILTSDQFLNSLINTVNDIPLSELVKIMRSFTNCMDLLSNNYKFRELIAVVESRMEREDQTNSHVTDIRTLVDRFKSQIM